MTDASSAASVTATSNEAGGLMGRAYFTNSVTDSYATGSVTGGSDVGGLIGEIEDGSATTLSNVYASGKVTGPSASSGGLVGTLGVGTTTTTSGAFWDSDTTGQTSTVGSGPAPIIATAIDDATSRTVSPYTGFDITNVWYIAPGDTRPMLRDEYSTAIFTPHALQLISLNPAVSYTLGADLNLTNAFTADSGGHYADVWGASGFKPIGDLSAGLTSLFTGSFNGQGHTITGLMIDRASSNYVGLFGYVKGDIAGVGTGGNLSNVILSGGDITGLAYVGTLAGYVDHGSVASASASATVTGISSTSAFTGGLVGVNQGSAISLSSASGTVAAIGGFVGGLVGYNQDGGTITQSFATGNVTSTSTTSGSLVGGLVGANGYTSSSSAGTISNSYATGIVTGSSGSIGGLAGQNDGTITESYATGHVVGLTDNVTEIGGFVGKNYNDGEITESYATGAVQMTNTTAGNDIGGFVGENEGAISDSYSFSQVTAAGSTSLYLGGFAGSIYSGAITNSFATGYVTGPTPDSFIGGFAGFDLTFGSALVNDYWNTQTTGRTTGSYFGGTGLTGRTTAQLQSALPTGFSSSTWGQVAGTSYPYLTWQFSGTPEVVAGTVYTAGGASAGGGIEVSARSAGTAVDSAVTGGTVTTGANGYYYYLIDPSTLAPNVYIATYVGTGGVALTTYGTIYTQNLDIYEDTRHLLTTGTSAAAAVNGLSTALGSDSVATTQLATANLRLDAQNHLDLDTALTATGDITVESGADIAITSAGTVDAGGDILLVAADDVTNARTAGDALTARGRWLIYGDNVDDATSMNLTPDFIQYGATATVNTGNTGVAYGRPTLSSPNAAATGNGFISRLSSELTITGVSKTYDGTTGLTGASYTISGGNGATSLTFGTPTSGSFGGSAAGAQTVTVNGLTVTSAKQGTIDIYGLTVDNISAASVGTIDKRDLTITADAASKIYGNANPASGTATGDNLVAGDSITSVTLTSPATTASGVGSYDLTASAATGTGLSNYTITYATLTNGLTVTPRALTITADAESRVYGDANPTTGTATGVGLVNGNTITGVTLGSPATTTSSIGTYDLTASAATGTGLSNYTITYATLSNGLTVTPRALTITADAESRVYGDANPTSGTATGVGLVNGNTVTGVTLGSPATTTSWVGTYDLTASAATGTGLSNYTITYATLTNGLTVNARPITVTADSKNMTYGGTVPTLTYTVGGSGLVNGDMLSGALATTATSTSGANIYGITQGSLAASSNYALTYVGANLTVNKAALTVTANDASKIYDGNAYSGGNGVGYSGFVGHDSASSLGGTLTYGGTAQGAVGAGSYGISASGLSSDNYTITYVDGGLTVNRAALTVTANDVSKTYDGLAYSGGNGVDYSGFVGHDSAPSLGGTLTYGGTAQGAVNAGSYGITASGLSSDNYTITYVDGGLTVNRA
ncbi:MAG: hypothetical protein KGI75_19905, partial [Rhizobiaceae bacterium]|nr:hypothetical protein [Rhizobiaceae bacterium]